MEEIIERFKMLPNYAHWIIAALPGVVLAAFLYTTDGTELEQQREMATQEQGVAENSLAVAKDKVAKLPKIEADLAEINSALDVVKSRLPDYFHIDEILQKTATIARETDVKIKVFRPNPEIAIEGRYRFRALPIHVTVAGKYAQLAYFFDKIIHFDKIMHVRDVRLSLDPASAINLKNDLGPPGNFKIGGAGSANKNEAIVNGEADIWVFRSARADETAASTGGATAPPGQPDASSPPPPPTEGS